MKRFYICSYGGCGSTMLTNLLEQFGEAYHIHDRFPKKELYLPEGEHFGDELDTNPESKIVFIYSAPEYSMATSCAWGVQHWRNIGISCPESIELNKEKYAKDNFDHIRFEEFFDNYYLNPRTYNVIFVNYHSLWEVQRELFCLLGIEATLPAYKNKERKIYKMECLDGFNKRLEMLPKLFIN